MAPRIYADVLAQLAGSTGPYVSVSIDATRTEPGAAHEIELRWRALADHIPKDFPAEVVGELATAASQETGFGGEASWLLIANREGILVDRALPFRPPRDEIEIGPAPQLLPLVRALTGRPPYVLVEVDRSGTDLDIVRPLGGTEHETVDGDNDVLHKARAGGSARRGARASAEPHIQARVEDSWERNAAEVAKVVDEVVARVRPAVVFLAGDDRAIGLLLEAVNGGVRSLAHKLGTGGRAAGTSPEATEAAIGEGLAEYAGGKRADMVERFNSAEARQTAAVRGLADTVTALQRGQVEYLLLQDNPLSTSTLWVGTEPLQLAVDKSDLADMGVDTPTKVRADAAFVWAALSTEAEVALLDPDDLDLIDGIGAALRWTDRSTPHDHIPDMPGHGEGPGLRENGNA